MEWPQAEALPKPGIYPQIQTSFPLYLCPQVGSSVPERFEARRAEEEVGQFSSSYLIFPELVTGAPPVSL